MMVDEKMLSDNDEELIDEASDVDSDENCMHATKDTVGLDPSTMIENGRQDNDENKTQKPSERAIVESRK